MKTTLKNNETAVLTVKKHWITLVPIFILSFYMSLFALKYDLNFLIILAIVLIIYKYIDRRNNVWIVTDFRVIDEYGVFTVNSKETPLDKINNISYRKSIFGRVMGFGSVMIQSAAESGVTTHRLVENPKLLKETITEYQEKYNGNSIGTQIEQIVGTLKPTSQKVNEDSPSISSEIEKLYALKVKGIISETEFEQGKNKILNSNG